jgi:hypothetical protein
MRMEVMADPNVSTTQASSMQMTIWLPCVALRQHLLRKLKVVRLVTNSAFLRNLPMVARAARVLIDPVSPDWGIASAIEEVHMLMLKIALSSSRILSQQGYPARSLLAIAMRIPCEPSGEASGIPHWQSIYLMISLL